MLYTDLSYYKLSVHLQNHLVWPQRLPAQNRVLKPFANCHKFFYFRISSLSKRQASSSDCCCRVHVWDKA